MDIETIITANEPVASYGTNSYSDVMMMLYSMPITSEVKERVTHRLVLEMKGKYLSQTISRINYLAALRDDWDGFGASRILPQVISNIRSVVLISEDADWHDWTISPNTNGTLFLQSTKRICSLSLGTHEYSFFSKEKNGRRGESHLPFSAEAFLAQMRLLNHQEVMA